MCEEEYNEYTTQNLIDRLYSGSAKNLGYGNIRLMRSSLASSPMLIGIFKPYIFIPDIKFDEKQLK